jgi:uncharacterized membrane protein YqiK
VAAQVQLLAPIAVEERMFAAHALFAQNAFVDFLESVPLPVYLTFGVFLALQIAAWLTIRYIPNDSVGVVEKLWSARGSVKDGSIVALNGEAGYQATLLRGGLHFGMWRWQYSIHKVPLVTIRQGKIGYVYARDGDPLPPSQTLGRVIESHNFQNAHLFLTGTSKGQRGRQRAILREGVYAINPALFVVITEDNVYSLGEHSDREAKMAQTWQKELAEVDGFDPVIIGEPIEVSDPLSNDHVISVDSIGIVTVQDGPSLPPGEIIAPAVGVSLNDPHNHNNFQDPEEFLAGGGQRGRQHMALTDGTYFINRWFASVELNAKTVVPIGYVGVVVSYYGQKGKDVSGDTFRHGERVGEGERGVWEKPLGPGKYPFNRYAGNIILVPTTNFVLHWVTGKSESHRYDESLRSIDLVTRDAYEPLLPLSVVVHIDYQRAPSVIQRFGDVKKLITQTIDPMLSAYFRDIAHKKTMLELLHDRDVIQNEARAELRRKFHDFDIECVDVLIGKPDSSNKDGKIETLLEQLRQRQLSVEQLETYDRQKAAADRLRVLNEANAHAAMQAQLTNAQLQVRIQDSTGEAELARARKQGEQTVVLAEAELNRSRRQAEQVVVMSDAELAKSRRNAEQTVVTAQAQSESRILAGKGEAQKILQEGLSEAAVLLRRISCYGDPRLYALGLVTDHLSKSVQPLVPERLFVNGGGENGQPQPASGMLGMLINLMVAEKSGMNISESAETNQLKAFADQMTAKVMENLKQAPAAKQ